MWCTPPPGGTSSTSPPSRAADMSTAAPSESCGIAEKDTPPPRSIAACAVRGVDSAAPSTVCTPSNTASASASASMSLRMRQFSSRREDPVIELGAGLPITLGARRLKLTPSSCRWPCKPTSALSNIWSILLWLPCGPDAPSSSCCLSDSACRLSSQRRKWPMPPRGLPAVSMSAPTAITLLPSASMSPPRKLACPSSMSSPMALMSAGRCLETASSGSSSFIHFLLCGCFDARRKHRAMTNTSRHTSSGAPKPAPKHMPIICPVERPLGASTTNGGGGGLGGSGGRAN
mmetsp:Transcript_17222/g.51724  ORF Transcript_17222/g.51724 Transcript_17222/m.51724 type:complete len:289 (-) Transcript_17222:549-1415(-)|eukprot:362536-Chlamydomonas_euryale.AAC.4